MKIKLDENLSRRWLRLFQEAGHEADTVYDEKLSGAKDEAIFDTCVREQRCLVSLDMDFADILRFPPSTASGVVILRSPKGNSFVILEHLIRNLLRALDTEPVSGCLWIVEAGRIRVHEHS